MEKNRRGTIVFYFLWPQTVEDATVLAFTKPDFLSPNSFAFVFICVRESVFGFMKRFSLASTRTPSGPTLLHTVINTATPLAAHAFKPINKPWSQAVFARSLHARCPHPSLHAADGWMVCGMRERERACRPRCTASTATSAQTGGLSKVLHREACSRPAARIIDGIFSSSVCSMLVRCAGWLGGGATGDRAAKMGRGGGNCGGVRLC